MEEKNYPSFSVAMSVYGKDNPEWFDEAFCSITHQTVNPNEIVLVVDGVIPDEINHVIKKYETECNENGINLKVIRFESNKGLGIALKKAIEECGNEIIARMDSDDIALKTRFEEQLKIFNLDPKADIVGGDIEEFIGNINNRVGKREVPQNDDEIKKYIKKRCPLNHVTVMYKKKAVIAAGNYKDLFWNEDYYLWIRMAEKKCVMRNTGTTLVYVRVGEEMYKRRGGKRYFQSEKFLQDYMLKTGMINYAEYSLNLVKRFIVQILLPNNIRGWVFKKFARS